MICKKMICTAPLMVYAITVETSKTPETSHCNSLPKLSYPQSFLLPNTMEMYIFCTYVQFLYEKVPDDTN